jgi:predicted alpha/beta superfamily hydrolase
MHTRSIVFAAIWLLALNTRALVCQQPALMPDTGQAVSLTRNTESFRVTSSVLKQTRQIRIALPASFARSGAERRYPVAIVTDGAWLLNKVAVAADELSRNGLAPEMIIVAIENTDDFKGRVHDLTPAGLSVSGSGMNEGGDAFLDFIEQELLPAVDKQFRGAAPRIFVGTSSGGILATYVAATRSTYRAVIALDAPIHLQDNWLAGKLIARAKAATNPLRYISYDVRFGWPDDQWQALVAAAPSTWQLHREKLNLEGHETMQMIGAYLGLREAFRDYSRFAAPVAPTTSILPYYAKVGESLGAPVIAPKVLVQNVVEDLLMEGRGAAAREAYNTLLRGYGPPADSAKLSAQIAEMEKQPAPTETVEGLLATPFPTPAEARAYIGEWNGETWHNENTPHRNETIRIRVENGRVVGETVHPDAPPEYRVQRWEYLRITPAGMTWGYMNGMRPRGVILHEATLKAGTLAGQARFGGINFKRPDGSEGPLQYFTYHKAK